MQDPENVSGLEPIIIPRAHDLGGFEVRRALPSTQRQMVGPFAFFDQMGPGDFLTGWFGTVPGDDKEFISLPHDPGLQPPRTTPM